MGRFFATLKTLGFVATIYSVNCSHERPVMLFTNINWRIYMNIEHNSQEIFYRSPFGALTCDSEVRLRLAISGAGIPHSVRVIYKEDNSQKIALDMAFIFSVNMSSIYEVAIKMPSSPILLWYFFEVKTDEGTFYYANNKECLGGKGEVYTDIPQNLFQITVFDKSYKTPDWFKSTVAYQIFPDRFFNGNDDSSFLGNRCDIIKRNWGDMPYYKAEQFGGEYKANDFFGGNLKGIIKKLPYLKDLGISVIYLNPIFKAYSNHKYDTGSYEEIDEMFGDEETFMELCQKAEDMGIKIVLDGVFNHTGSDSMYFNKNGTYDTVGAYESQQSPYYSWFKFSKWPEEYESWWGIKTLPHVEEESEELRKYLLSSQNSIIKKWLKLGAYGWRLDVVDELPDFFVKELRKNAKAQKEDCVIIGEVWEDASNKTAYDKRREYFMGDELDSVMNYPMRSALIDAVLGKIDASMLARRLMSLKENYPKQSYYSLLNMVSGHDVERIVTLMGNAPSRHEVSKDFQSSFILLGDALEKAKKRARLILSLQMTLPGVPCIYYGDEIGMQGYGDPFCRSTYPWDKTHEIDPQNAMYNHFKKMISIRNSSSAFSTGEFECVYNIGSVFGFIRYNNDEKYVILANLSENNERIRLDVSRFGVSGMVSVLNENDTLTSQNGIYFADTKAYSLSIYKCK